MKQIFCGLLFAISLAAFVSLTARSETIHYWDDVDFADRAVLSNVAAMEERVEAYLTLLHTIASEDILAVEFRELLSKARENEGAFELVTRLMEIALFSLDSPLRDEERYLVFLNEWKKVGCLDQVEALILDDKIEMVGKNRMGTLATDFCFTTPDGTGRTLMGSLPPEGADLLLLFFDPDCNSCEETIEAMKRDRTMASDVLQGRLQVLAVYPGDNEQSWRRKLKDMPADWTVGINFNEIEDGDLYFFPEMPTIYLLDWQGIIKQKDIRILAEDD